MSQKTLTDQDIRRMAAAIGLERLSDEHIAQLTRATNLANGRRTVLPAQTLTPADEPAHVYRLGPRVPR